MEEHYPFTLQALPYAYDAMEPYIDKLTMEIHHDKLLGNYVDKLNNALADYPQYHNYTLVQLINEMDKMDEKLREEIRHNAGGVYNHNNAFKGLANPSTIDENSELYKAIIDEYGSLDSFKGLIKQTGLSQFGSGYAWVVVNADKKLKVVKTANQDTPFMYNKNLCPVILVDVWEHAYFIKYHEKRADYIENLFNIINWEVANQNYINAINCK